MIIFDCDGVIIDSEGIASTICARDISERGWEMTAQQAQDYFLGMSITDMQPMIETRIGRALPAAWRAELAQKLVAALGTDSKLIPGAREMLERVNTLGIPWCIASNSSDEELAVKFSRTGISHLTDGRAYSAASVIAKGGRAKPAPDLFLAAAAGSQIHPQNCLVVEDSALGITGAVAAGMPCYGFAPDGNAAPLLAAGARAVWQNLSDLFGVLA
ncbi:hydrolase [Acidocella aquatica]|uniref:Hydrolase n=1 Tax=Acidocella aquatica TaxID=1922313 RepID=A0ABQ6AAR4_9PROT|nr:hydrolase [Acidocella aquatica]